MCFSGTGHVYVAILENRIHGKSKFNQSKRVFHKITEKPIQFFLFSSKIKCATPNINYDISQKDKYFSAFLHFFTLKILEV